MTQEEQYQTMQEWLQIIQTSFPGRVWQNKRNRYTLICMEQFNSHDGTIRCFEFFYEGEKTLLSNRPSTWCYNGHEILSDFKPVPLHPTLSKVLNKNRQWYETIKNEIIDPDTPYVAR